MKKNSNGTKVKKTVSFTENKIPEPEAVVSEEREVLSKHLSYPVDLTVEEKESFSQKLNLQIAKIVKTLSQLKLSDQNQEVRDPLVELFGAIKNSENYEVKNALVQFWGVLPKDEGLFRKKNWQRVNQSLGSTKCTAQDCFADLVLQIDQDGDLALKEVLERYESALENYEGNVFERYEAKKKGLEEEAQRVEKEWADITSNSETNNAVLEWRKNSLAAIWDKKNKNLKKTEIDQYIFTVLPQEEELFRARSLIEADCEAQRLTIKAKISEEKLLNPENAKRLDWGLRIIDTEEKVQINNLINSSLPSNDCIIAQIQSDPYLAQRYQDQLRKELERGRLVQELPMLENHLQYLKFIESNYCSGEQLNSWISEFLQDSRDQEDLGSEDHEPEWHLQAKKKVLQARNDLCYRILVHGDNEVKIELIEHLRNASSYCEENLKEAINQCGNLEIRKALLNYEKAAAEFENIIVEKNNVVKLDDDWNPEFEALERKKKIGILELKERVLEKEIELMEMGEPLFKDMILMELKEEKQALTEEEESWADCQIDNFIVRANKKKIKIFCDFDQDDARELDLEVQWQRSEIKSLEDGLQAGEFGVEHEAELREKQSILRVDEAKLEILDKEEEIRSATLEMQLNEEIVGFGKALSYPVDGRKFSDELRRRSEENALLEDELRNLKLELCYSKLNLDLLQCEQHEVRLPQIKALGIKMTLCNHIKECDNSAAKDLTIKYFQEFNSFKILPEEAFEFKDLKARKIFIDYGAAITEYNREDLSEKVANQPPEADRNNELLDNVLAKVQVVLEIRSKMIENDADQEGLKKELEVAQINFIKARIESHIYRGEKNWQAIQKKAESLKEEKIDENTKAIAELNKIIAESSEGTAELIEANNKIKLLEVQRKIIDNTSQQIMIGAKSTTYNHNLVTLITSLPRSETQFNEALDKEVDKISPRAKTSLMNEYKILLKELRLASVKEEDVSEENNFDPENITLTPESPKNSPEKAALVVDALTSQDIASVR